MPYSSISDKKFLDSNGLTYFSRKLNNYPTNDVIEAVVDGIQDALSEQQGSIDALENKVEAYDSYPYFTPLQTKTYTGVAATENNNQYGSFFYLKVRGTTYTTMWHVKVRVRASVPEGSNAQYYFTDSVFDLWGMQKTYAAYVSQNHILSTSYRPFYYHSAFLVSQTGYNNDCGTWIGFNLCNATNPTTILRTFVIDLLEYQNCEVDFVDTLYTPNTIPERADHTSYYSSTVTSISNFNACDNGVKMTGDANTTSISNLLFGNGKFNTDSLLYRYQLLVQKDENTLSPLNNNNNTTGTSKTMLTDLEFDPFGLFAYYYSTAAVSAGAQIGASAVFYAFNGIDLRYTFNCGSTLTTNLPFYLVVTPLSNGKVKLASTTPWSQTLPNINDGKYYILLGRTYSTYQITLYPYHPIYYHDGTSVKQLSGLEIPNKADKKDTVLETTLSCGRYPNSDIGQKSMAFGNNAIASGRYSVSLGHDNTASGESSLATGLMSEASGAYAQAFGNGTIASGRASLAAGDRTTANGHATVAVGVLNSLPTLYPAWEAEEYYDVGDKVDKGGYGYECITSNHDSSWVSANWKRLPSNTDMLVAVGNGSQQGITNVRSNAAAIDKDGNAYLKGDIFINCDANSQNGESIGNQVVVGSTQPQASNNKLWINTAVQNSYSVPTYSEFLSIQNTINGKYSKPSGGIPAADLADTYIEAPSSPATGAFLVFNGTAWVAQTLSIWQGGNY